MQIQTAKGRVLVILAAAGAALAGGVHVAAQAKTATLYARVADSNGKAVTDLRPSETQLTVDNKAGKISSVTYIGGPRRVLLLVSNNIQAEINPLREGLAQFVLGVPAADEIGLGTTAGQYHARVEPSLDRTRLLEFIRSMPVEQGNNVTMDALVEGNSRLLDKESLQPVIVVVTTEGSESSSVRDDEYNRFIQRFAARGGVAHVVLVSVSASGAPPRPTLGGNRAVDNAILSVDTDAESIVTMNVTKSTGGRYELVNSITAIPEKLREIAAEIAADEKATAGWYKVVFAADKPPTSVRFSVARPDAKVQQLSPGRPRMAAGAR